MADIIQPRVLKGFRDFLPDAEGERRLLAERLERTFSTYGFVPIDTPILEYAEILLGKGGGETDKQVYRFKDHGGRDVAMRFDLTVPFARFMAEHVDELYLPFRRYHIAKVWRGENTQRGRYREFMQCDFDIVGVDSSIADADIVLVINAAMKALEVGEFTVRINHRGIFNRFLANAGAGEKSVEVLRTVDKLDKIGKAAVLESLAVIIGMDTASRVLEFIAMGDYNSATLDRLENLAGGPDGDSIRLREVISLVEAAGAGNHIRIDPSITRGLDYYTGIVFETTLTDASGIGSVCSGGRYDELANLYTTRKLPGVGASVGLDRLVAALELAGVKQKRPHGSGILVLCLDKTSPEVRAECSRMVSVLRSMKIIAEYYPEPKKMGQQFTYAEKKGYRYAIILGNDEMARGVLVLKDLESRESEELAGFDALVQKVSPVNEGL